MTIVSINDMASVQFTVITTDGGEVIDSDNDEDDSE
jgi:FKBP-type peptidyl-prolyl cis-trans isomerase 2